LRDGGVEHDTTSAGTRRGPVGQNGVCRAIGDARRPKAGLSGDGRGRAGRFETLEEPLALSSAIIKASARHDVILVDCLTLWITNMLMAGEEVAGAVEELAATLVQVKRAKVVLVSNEVGLGIVPDNAMARTFRDLAGSAHQRLAEICDDVYFVVAGLPMVLKGEPPASETPRIYEA
jgi:adenosylcobinamide kinase / adenosylcobinamide-phosphate guanylyltransferase